MKSWTWINYICFLALCTCVAPTWKNRRNGIEVLNAVMNINPFLGISVVGTYEAERAFIFLIAPGMRHVSDCSNSLHQFLWSHGVIFCWVSTVPVLHAVSMVQHHRGESHCLWCPFFEQTFECHTASTCLVTYYSWMSLIAYCMELQCRHSMWVLISACLVVFSVQQESQLNGSFLYAWLSMSNQWANTVMDEWTWRDRILCKLNGIFWFEACTRLGIRHWYHFHVIRMEWKRKICKPERSFYWFRDKWTIK